MLSDKQLELITNRALTDFLLGRRKDDGELRLPAIIPNAYELSLELNDRLRTIVLGRPFFTATHQGEVTSASIFNRNLDDLVDDFTILIDELIAQIYALTRHFGAAEYEFRKIEGRLRRMKFDVDGLLLVCQNADGYLYSVGDNFRDMTFVDAARTTATVDTKGGLVELPDTMTTKVDLGHYSRSRTPDDFIVVGGSAEFLGTTFSNCIDDMEDSYFMVSVSSGSSVGATIEFSLKLNPNNDPVAVNAITMSSNSTYTAGLSYRNTYTDDWVGLSDGKVVERNTKYSIRGAALANMSDVPHPGVTQVKFKLSKGAPDRVNDGTYEYDFLIRNISFYVTGNTGKAHLYSTALPFEEWDGRKFTVNQVSLSVDEEIPPDTYIKYYIGMDPYASGTLVDAAGDAVGDSSVDISGFQYRDGYGGASGVLYSTLRDLNITGWTNWEPPWIHINPLEHDYIAANASGVLPQNRVDFSNYEVIDSTTTGWDNTEVDIINGIHFYQIYNFPSDPRDVELRQGRHTWIRTSEYYSREETMEAEGTFVEDDRYDFYLYLGPDYNPGTGYVLSPGKVVRNSVSSIVWKHANIDSGGSKFGTSEETPQYLADVHVSYDVDAGTATLKKNPATTWDLPDMHVKFKYKYYSTSDKYRFETNVYVPPDSTPYITVTNPTDIEKIIVENIGATAGSTVYAATHLTTNPNIPVQRGWNKVIIYANEGTTWDPLTSVTIPDSLEYYAYMEPLQQVGRRALLYNTHRNDHSKMTIYPSGGEYYMVVNNPAATTTDNGATYYHPALGTAIGAAEIFADGASVNDFYDLSYNLISREVTSVLLKAELGSSSDVSPTLKSYEIRGGDDIKA